MNTRNLRFSSNRACDILGLFHEELDDMYGSGEVGVFLDMLFETFLGWDKVQLLTSKEQTVDQSDLLRFHWALEDLHKHRPIQHIIGHTDFCGCRINVNPEVLIPRPETEEIVNWIINNLNFPACSQALSTAESNIISEKLPTLNFLDLCTGSGCIAIALKKAFPEAKVTAVDISPKALEVAKRNAESNGAEVRFLQADILDSGYRLPATGYQLIISNPPYVRDSERATMRRNVLDYDPALALFVPDEDPLRFYRAIAEKAKQSLVKEGLLVVEINEALAEETSALLQGQGFNPEVHTDFRNKRRWISAY